MTEPTEAAFHRADELSERAPGGNYRAALARHLQEVSDAASSIIEHPRGPSLWGLCKETLAPFILPEPVDPLLIEAREMVAAEWKDGPSAAFAGDVTSGKHDNCYGVQIALAALRRGIEIGARAQDGGA